MPKDKFSDYSATEASNTDVGSVGIEGTDPPSNFDNALRELMTHIAEHFSEGTIASATTCDIGGEKEVFLNVTGTTTITAFGTVKAGTWKLLLFAGAVTVTHNGTSLILPGGANITTAAGDMMWAVSEGSGNWRVAVYTDASSLTVTTTGTQTLTNKTLTTPTLTLKQSAGAAPTAEGDIQWDTTDNKLVVGDGSAAHAHLQAGKWGVFIPAGAMTAASTNGAESGSSEMTTNAHNFSTLAFDASTDEYACFEVWAPASWNEGTVTFQALWTTTATDADGVAWALQGVGVADGDDSDVAYGTAVVVTDDAQSNADDVLVTAESSAVTIAGSPAAGEMLQFRLFRDVSDANDVMTEDALLRGIVVFFTLDDVHD